MEYFLIITRTWCGNYVVSNSFFYPVNTVHNVCFVVFSLTNSPVEHSRNLEGQWVIAERVSRVNVFERWIRSPLKCTILFRGKTSRKAQTAAVPFTSSLSVMDGEIFWLFLWSRQMKTHWRQQELTAKTWDSYQAKTSNYEALKVFILHFTCLVPDLSDDSQF